MSDEGRAIGHRDGEKTSLVDGNTTDLRPVCSLLGPGLKHGPTGAPWDLETVLYGPSEWATYGVTDGWVWATDTSTALILRSEKWLDIDDHRTTRGRQVIELCQRDFPSPIYALDLRAAAMLGGSGTVPQLGLLDLDRLRDAVLWAADKDASVLVARDEMKGGPLVRIAGPTGRVALVIGMTPKDGTEHLWRPTIDLPLWDVTNEVEAQRDAE